MRLWLLNFAKAVLPDQFVQWYRRKRAYRRYADALAYQIYDREVRLELEDLEGRVAASRAGFTDRIVRDILERTELIQQGLDRKIEGVSARHGQAIRDLRMEVESLRADIQALRGAIAPATSDGETTAPKSSSAADSEAAPASRSVPTATRPAD